MRGIKRATTGYLILLAILSVTAWASVRGDGEPELWPTRAWATSVPEEQGVDSGELARAVELIRENDPKFHSLLVVRNGHVVLDAYFHPFAEGSLHDVASVTKSVTATLIGIAVEQGLIKDLRQPVLGYFSGRDIARLDDAKKAMTLRNLLTMRSGLACVNRPTEVTLFQMLGSPDWVRFMLDLPMEHPPGAAFAYSSGAVHLLSAVIRHVSGKPALEFAREKLFGPLGIRELSWPAGPQGDNCGWGTLRLHPRDMAKIGYLYLKGGVWEGRRILPSWWVEEATRAHVGLGRDGGYGYLWWTQGDESYSARGRGGQYIVVVPERELVVVMTGGGASISPWKVVDEFIAPAVKSRSGPILTSPEKASRLDAAVARAARGPEPGSGSPAPLPDVARRVSGRTFVLEPNALAIRSMTLTFLDDREAVFKIETFFDTDRDPEYRLGLDGIPRRSPGRFGIPAEGKGRWTADGTFGFDIDEVGNINRYRGTLMFEGDGVTVALEESTGLGSFRVRGKDSAPSASRSSASSPSYGGGGLRPRSRSQAAGLNGQRP